MLLVPRSVLCQLSGAAIYFRCTPLDIVVYLMTTHSEVAKCYNGKIFMPKTLSN